MQEEDLLQLELEHQERQEEEEEVHRREAIQIQEGEVVSSLRLEEEEESQERLVVEVDLQQLREEVGRLKQGLVVLLLKFVLVVGQQYQ